MCTQNLICCCCCCVALLLLGTFASFDYDALVPVQQARPDAAVELLLSGDDSAIGEAGQQLVHTQEGWQALWASHLGPDAVDPQTGEVSPAAPELDFETHLVVAVFVGRGVTARGLKLESYASDDEQLTIRYMVRSYQTAMSGRRTDGGEALREWEERYGNIRPYGFFLVPRSERTIVLLSGARGFGWPEGREPRWTEKARLTPPAPQPAER